MKASFLSRKWHKWLFLVIGVQMCLWAISGFYMVTVSIDYIHGDHLVKDAPATPAASSAYSYEMTRLVQDFPTATAISTDHLQDRPVYAVTTPAGRHLIDAATGEKLSPLPKSVIEAMARKLYAGPGGISAMRLLTENPPSEIQSRPLPLWRVDFDDPWSPSLYLSPVSGELVTKRHDFWRAFDFLWMFHIMDYENRSDVNNWLLRIAAAVVTLSTLTGIWLLFYSFRHPKVPTAGAPVASPKGQFFRVTHKWLGLIIGLQVTIWALTGLAMAILDHDTVQGHDMAHHKTPQSLLSGAASGGMKAASEILARDNIQKLALRYVNGQLAYEVTEGSGIRLLDAASGRPFPIDDRTSRTIAAADYSGSGKIAAVEKVDMPTADTPRLTGPAWKVAFDDGRDTTLYISRDTGEVVGRVNDATRLFNFAIMLHFMDYPGNNHFNSPWIIVTGFATLWLALSGLILIFQSFSRTEFKAAWQSLTRRKGRLKLNILDIYGGLDNRLAASYGAPLYDSLAEAGIKLPSSCGGGGSCGLCRVKVTDKAHPVLEPDRHHFSEKELADGYRLACQHRLTQDTTVELPEEALSENPCQAEVIASRFLTPNIKEITLRLPEGESFTYQAGSYILVDIPKADGATLQRAYSLATPPEERPEEIVLNIRRIPAPEGQPDLPAGIGSHYMCGLNVGDSVTLSGPFGHFAARDSQNEMIFIGGGAGMAPLRAIIRDQLLYKKTNRKISFWYGVRNTDEIFYQEEFDSLVNAHDNMTFQIGLSDPRHDDNWDGPTGHIHEITMKRYLADHPDLDKAEFYLCGPPAMLKATRAMLRDIGIAEERIAFDDFGI